jgi:hypothetical protein
MSMFSLGDSTDVESAMYGAAARTRPARAARIHWTGAVRATSETSDAASEKTALAPDARADAIRCCAISSISAPKRARNSVGYSASAAR